MRCYNKKKKKKKGRFSAVGIPPFFPAITVSETHSIKAVTVLCSSQACFGPHPRMIETPGAKQSSVPAEAMLHKRWVWFVLVGK